MLVISNPDQDGIGIVHCWHNRFHPLQIHTVMAFVTLVTGTATTGMRNQSFSRQCQSPNKLMTIDDMPGCLRRQSIHH